jgi:LacI family transcriptional regulator
MVTMSDIAKAAGVSITTVSHVLNESRSVRKETRDRVNAAVIELGYRPNALARSLRRQETRTIGFVVPDLSNPFFAEIGQGLEEASFDAGYNVIFSHTSGDPTRERRVVSSLLEKRVDGIIIASVETRADRLSELSRIGVPMVMVDRDCADFAGDIVLADNVAGGQQVVQHLAQLGHTSIGCVVANAASQPASPGRFYGFQQALSSAGLSSSSYVFRGDQHKNRAGTEVDIGYQALKDILARPSPPTAVFLTNDLMAIGALRAAAELGVRVPDDLSIIGFDDIALAQYTSPALTTVGQPRQQMGRLAAQLLIDRSTDKTRLRERVILGVSLVVRESTAPPRLIA